MSAKRLRFLSTQDMQADRSGERSFFILARLGQASGKTAARVKAL
ncbi:hypothetical protein [Paenibacillus athensensis]|nr:hypothetical protein [Paenibacillus athensensis]